MSTYRFTLSVGFAAALALPMHAAPAHDKRTETFIVANETGANSLDIHDAGANRPSYGVAWNCYDRLIT